MPDANSNLIQPPVISAPAAGRSRWVWLLSLALIAGLAVLYFFNPVQHRFYPACQFYQITHLHCPGCGSLRALHQLTHGHVVSAFLSNPLLVVSMPVFAWLGFQKWRLSPNRSGKTSLIQPAFVWVILGIVFLFGVLRNLPFPAFSWMSP